MADRINLNRFKNKNLPPFKDAAKTAAAVVLLLSTTASVPPPNFLWPISPEIMTNCIAPIVIAGIGLVALLGGRSGRGSL